MNRKSGFRHLSNILGFKTVPGYFCNSISDFTSKIGEAMDKLEAVIIKFDRSSNGFGHIVFDRNKSSLIEIKQKFEDHLNKFSGQPSEFIIEKYMPFKSVPSIEIEITNNGVIELYSSDQRCINNSFICLCCHYRFRKKYV